jgi:multidrug efflux pump subunit AcrA (membrane-fusion protein)
MLRPVVPQRAIQEIDYKPVVFVKADETHFEKRNIETREKSDHGVELISGLKESEIVADEGSFFAEIRIPESRNRFR